jgi:ribosome-associated toxin RatA of RatAB toxin-antitoxin module
MQLEAIALLACLAASAVSGLDFAARGVEQCSSRREELGKGDVVYIEQPPLGGVGVALTACALVDGAPATVWPVLRDCEEYHRFLPGVEQSRLRGRRDNVATCEALIQLPFPLGAWVSVERATETATPGGGFERRWSLESGTYRRMEGLWSLLAWGDAGERTLLVYQLDMDPDTLVPDFLLRRAQSATAPKVFDAIRQRVRQCAADDASC